MINQPASSSDKLSAFQYGQALKKVMHGFSKASKNSSIYPLDHTVSKNSLNDLIAQLNSFTKAFGDLRLYVEKDGLFCLKDKKRVAPSEQSELSELLFRDGILWIEFKEKLLFPELYTFLLILREYRHLEDASQGDIVTALWEADLTGIRYEAADIYWDIDDFIAFREISEGPYPEAGGEEASSKDAAASGSASPDTLQPAPPPSSAPEVWKLTKDEIGQLRQMIDEEENWNKTDDVLDVLLGILEEQYTLEDFTIILDFIAEELQTTLLNHEFRLADNLMSKLSILQKEWAEDRPWIAEAMESFFLSVSSSRILGVFDQIYPRLENTSKRQRRSLQGFLNQLLPWAVIELAPLLVFPVSADIRSFFLAVIRELAERSFEPFEQVLCHQKDPMVICRLIPLLSDLSDPRIESLLLRLTRHSNENVRMEAVKVIHQEKTVSTEKLFHLINDDSIRIKKSAVSYMGRARNSLLEKQLLAELRQWKQSDENHLLELYRLLGRCGSSHSISFLENKLLGSAWKSLVGVDALIERQGAALALLELHSDEAESILEKASSHRLSGIKNACRKASRMQHEL